jgi:hypothetical protein
MFTIAETSINLKYPADNLEKGKELSTDDLWNQIDKNF